MTGDKNTYPETRSGHPRDPRPAVGAPTTATPPQERYTAALNRVEEILGAQMANENIAIKLLSKVGAHIQVDPPALDEKPVSRSLHEVITDLQQTTNRLNSRLIELDELL